MSQNRDDGAVRDATVPRLLVVHRDELLRFLVRRTPRTAEPEDLLQQAAVRALQSARTLRSAEKGRAWLFVIVRRVLADARAQPMLSRGEQEAVEDERADASATCRCSVSLLAGLKPAFRDVLQRVDIAGEPIEAAAAALGITANNATVRLHRARSALRERLVKHCGVRSARECLDCSCWERRCCEV